MTIYDTLKNDHDKVKALFEQALQEPSQERRNAIMDEIKHQVKAHSEAEEHTFYKALKQETQLKGMIEHALQEHDEIDEEMDNVELVEADDSEWIDSVRALKIAFEEHVVEEEGKIFDAAKKILSDSHAKDLGLEMEKLKRDKLKLLMAKAVDAVSG